MSKKPGKNVNSGRDKYSTTMQTETYRQQMATEKRILQSRTKADMDKLDPYFSVNNNYLHYMKKENIEEIPSINIKHPLDQLDNLEHDYCQKCKKDKSYCPHKIVDKMDAAVTLNFPITSAQNYGWGKPLDKLNWGYGIRTTLENMNKYSFREGKEKTQKEATKKST